MQKERTAKRETELRPLCQMVLLTKLLLQHCTGRKKEMKVSRIVELLS